MRSLVQRALLLSTDAQRVFFDPEIPLDAIGEARELQQEFYNALMAIITRIQLQDIEMK